MAVGSIIAMPSSGVVVARLGATCTVTAMGLTAAVGLAGAAIGYRLGVAPRRRPASSSSASAPAPGTSP